MKESSQVIEMTSDSEENREKPLDFDTILNEVGGVGLYQILVGIFSGLFAAYGSFIIMNFVFTAAVPDHRYNHRQIAR